MAGFSGWTLIDPLNLTGVNQGPKEDANAQAQAYRDGAPKPAPVQFNPIYNPSTQSLGPQAQQLLAGNQLDMTGLNEFQSRALQRGPSDWAQKAGDQQNQLAMNAKSQGAQTVAGQGAAARAGLASRGGLSSGAAERTAQGGANNYLAMDQQVNQQNTQNQMQIGMNDEQNKLSMMGQLPGMQLAAANFGLNKTQAQLGANSTDVSNSMQGADALNKFNLGQYQTQMAGYGAGQTAAATAQAGKHKK